MFMPVATQASLKGLTPEQLEETGCKLCLNNTYHLGLKPGQAVLDTIGGAHKLQGWKGNILTDSGGWVSPLSSVSVAGKLNVMIVVNGCYVSVSGSRLTLSFLLTGSKWSPY